MAIGRFSVLLSGAVLIYAPMHAESSTLSEAELKAEIIGTELEGRRMGIRLKILHHEDGASTIRSSFRDRDGKWDIVGNQLCVLWDGEDEASCSNFERRDNGGFRVEPLGINVKPVSRD